jgi:hypothetical protein
LNVLALIVTATSAAACIFFSLRANALKREYAGDNAATYGVRFWIFIQAAVAGFHAQAVFFTQAATWTELILALAGAGYAAHLWYNVRRTVPYFRASEAPTR